jgi:ribonuclease HI
MNNRQVFEKMKSVRPNTKVSLTIADAPDYTETTHTTLVRMNNGAKFVLQDEDDSDVFAIPFAADDTRVITHIDVLLHTPLFVNTRLRNADPNPNDPTIYVDGGCRPNPGVGAAGIKAYEIVDGNVEVIADIAQLYPHSTNNIMEFVAGEGAIRLAVELHQKTGKRYNIVFDSEPFYKAVIENQCSDAKLRPIAERARDRYIGSAGFITLCTMARSDGNPADKTCTAAILQNKSSAAERGFGHIFMADPPTPPLPRQRHPKPVTTISSEIESDTAEIPRTLNELANVTKHKNRDRAPDHSVAIWSLLVRHQLQRFIDAEPGKKEDELMRFFLLPTWYLPRNASTSRILHKLQIGRPFATDMTAANRRERTHDRHHNLTENIQRLVADYKMRSANRLLSSAADLPQMEFDAKVTGMQQKILDGSFTTSIPRKTVRPISGTEVTEAMRRCNRQAANAVDGWSRTLLEQAFSVDSEVASMLGNLLHWILTAEMSPFMQQVIDLSRGVPLPKEDASGVRPICVSSIFLKLLGNIAAARDKTKPSIHQYAIGYKDGARRVIHKVRKFLKDNPDGAVLRFDISNAYGTLPRPVLEDIIKDKSIDESLRQYFRLVYGKKSAVMIRGPDGPAFIYIGDGVKQGDATSSLLFCLGVDRAIEHINRELARRGIRAHVFMYMDDLTICVGHEDANRVTRITIEAFEQLGLKINEAKSKVLCSVEGAYDLPHCTHDQEFIILGANVAMSDASFQAFTRRLLKRQADYFKLFDEVPLHPQIKATLLRICGHPRILYHCATTPPKHMKRVAEFFDDTVIRLYQHMIDPSGHTKIPKHIVHDESGLGVPNYTANLHDLFGAFERMSLEDDPRVPSVSLTTNQLDTTTTGPQLDSQWMFYDTASTLTPNQFATALAIRLNVLPRQHWLVNYKCNCGYAYTADDRDSIDHVLLCDRSTPFGHTHRHNLVRDAIISAARHYGVTTSKEPTCFSYNNGHNQRPDALFHTEPLPIATDVSLVSGTPAGEEIAAAEEKKVKTHKTATADGGAQFIPFVMATRGTLGPKASSFISSLSRAVQPFLKRSFERHLRHAVANAAAKGRSDALNAASARHSVAV